MWHIFQTNILPFVIRWRVYDTSEKYVATFRLKQDAIDYVDFRCNEQDKASL